MLFFWEVRQKEKGIDIRKFQDPEGRNIPVRRVEGCWEIRTASTIEIEILNKAIPTYSWVILLLTNSHYGILDKLSCISYTSNKGWYSQSYGFSNSHVWTWELGHKEGWALKNWCFWMVVIEKTLESPSMRKGGIFLESFLNLMNTSEFGAVFESRPGNSWEKTW